MVHSVPYSAAPPSSDAGKTAALILGACMFTTGGAGLVVQYVIATITTNILGSSIIVWSLVIGVMMGAMGLSGWIQEKIGEKHLLEKFVTIEVLLALAGGFSSVILMWANTAVNEHFNLVLYSLVTLIGALIGLEIPIVMRIIEQQGIKLRHNLKYVFAADYLGAMSFMFVWVFILLPNLTVAKIGFLVAGINFLVAIGAIAFFGARGNFKNLTAVVLVTVMSSASLLYGYTRSDEWNVSLMQKLYDDPVVFSTTTKYQQLVVTRATNTRCGEEIRLYINGNTQFGSCDEHIYHDNLVQPAMTLAERTDHVLILGGGDGLALRDVLRYPVKSVTLVDLDPDMVKIARDNKYLSTLNQDAFLDSRVIAKEALGVTQDGGAFREINLPTGRKDPATKQEEFETVATVRHMHIDAAKFLEITNDKYDVVIVDLPDPSSIELSRLYTREFYAEIQRKLLPGGVMVVQSTSPLHAREVFLEIGRTLSASGLETIPYHDNIPSFGDWGYWLACHEYGCREKLLEQIATLESFGSDTEYLTPERLRANLSFGRYNGAPYFESTDEGRINTMADSTMFIRYLNDSWKSY